MTPAVAPVELRRMISTDVPRVVSDWTDAHRNGDTGGDPFASLIGHRSYVRAFRALQMRAIERGRVEVLALCDAPTGLEIVGWGCAEWDVLHFVSVKRSFQGQGMGRVLVERLGAETSLRRHSHMTARGRSIVRALSLLYDPYAFTDRRD